MTSVGAPLFKESGPALVFLVNKTTGEAISVGWIEWHTNDSERRRTSSIPTLWRSLHGLWTRFSPSLSSSGKRLGFAVLVFDFGDGGNMQWCSNAKREDMIAALRELLGKWAADGSVPN